MWGRIFDILRGGFGLVFGGLMIVGLSFSVKNSFPETEINKAFWLLALSVIAGIYIGAVGQYISQRWAELNKTIHIVHEEPPRRL